MILSRIDPGNAFKIHVCVDKYTATGDYEEYVEMVEQEHVVCLDLSSECSLSKFVEKMTEKIIWGRDQQLLVWGVDKDSGTEWIWQSCNESDLDPRWMNLLWMDLGLIMYGRVMDGPEMDGLRMELIMYVRVMPGHVMVVMCQ
jgi:hypothetical protein